LPERAVTDRVLLSANRRNFDACVQLAQVRGLGIEVMAFAFADTLDGDWHELTEHYRPILKQVPGAITMHGPFMDMAPGSPDAHINQVCIERYQHAIQIGAALEVEKVVFHANFIAPIHTSAYRSGWHERNLNFWQPLAEYAGREGVLMTVENMWEFDPDIIGDLVKQINHPYLKVCLDVGHAHLYGEVPFARWLNALEPVLAHVHMNNNDGKLDLHQPLDRGVLDYGKLVAAVRELRTSPTITLEMDDINFFLSSLPYFDLPG